MTLRRRLALVYVGGGLAPLLALTGIGWLVAAAMARRQVEDDAARTARAIAQHLDERVDYLCGVLASREDRVRSTLEMYGRSIPGAVATQPILRAILLDADGTPRLRVTRSGLDPYDLRRAVEVESDFFRASDRDGFVRGAAAPAQTSVDVGWLPGGRFGSPRARRSMERRPGFCSMTCSSPR